MEIFVSWSADRLDSELRDRALSSDEAGLRQLNQSLDRANAVWKAWAETVRGEVLLISGGTGLLRAPAEHIQELEQAQIQYETALDSQCSVGVGTKISAAVRAALVSEIRGGGQIVLWQPEMVDELEAARKAQQQGQPVLKTESSIKSAAFRHRGSGEVIDSGRNHDLFRLPGGEASAGDYEDGFLTDGDQFLTREQAQQLLFTQGLKKADGPEGPQGPKTDDAAMNKPNAGGGYTGAQGPQGGAAPEGPVEEASRSHSQGETMAALAEDAPSPELTSAGDDFEQELHDHAQEQDKQDQSADEAKDDRADARKQVVDLLTQIRQVAPQLEQLKQEAPDLYQVMLQLIQATMISAKALLDPDRPDRQDSDQQGAPGEDSQEVSQDQTAAETSGSAPAPAQKSELQKGWPKDFSPKEMKFKTPEAEAENNSDLGINDVLADHYQEKGAEYRTTPEEHQKPLPVNPLAVHRKGLPTKPAGDLHRGYPSQAAQTRAFAAHQYNNQRALGRRTYTPHDAHAIPSISWQDLDASTEPGVEAGWDINPEEPRMVQAATTPEDVNTYDYNHYLPENVRGIYDLKIRHAPGRYSDYIRAQVSRGGREVASPWMYPYRGAQPKFDQDDVLDDEGARAAASKALVNHANWAHKLKYQKSEDYGQPGGSVLPQASGAGLGKAASLGGKTRDPKDFDPEDLESGVRHETGEHGPDEATARELAMDHLAEDPDYYRKLAVKKDEPLDKGGLGMPKQAPTHTHLNLPVGSVREGKVKVHHHGQPGEPEHDGWVQVRSGQVLSNDGHSISSRNPGGK